jgi:peptidoglycan/xylan/chitin deacetylase (PgdA/CDA1 family)
VVALLVLGAVAVGALSSTSRHGSAAERTSSTAARGSARAIGAGALAAAGRRSPARGRASGVGRAQTALVRREDQAIDRTLRYTPVVASGSPRHRDVALTFDDGPSAYTHAILRILAREHAAATFFVVGSQLNSYSAGLRAELRSPFPVGDHTENHAWLVRLNPRGQASQIGDAAARVKATGGPFPRLFRPPYGAFNATTLRILHRLHMLLILWSVDPGDWRRPGVGAIVSNVLLNTRPGAIVLMHDGGGYRDQTVKALPAIIRGLRRRHFQLMTVPQLLLEDPPPRHTTRPRLSGA